MNIKKDGFFVHNIPPPINSKIDYYAFGICHHTLLFP